LRLLVPDPGSIDWAALALSALALLLVFVVRAGIAVTLGACAGAALLWLRLAPV
jgi:hypothetical protein